MGMRTAALAVTLAILLSPVFSRTQQGKWADVGDKTAQSLIDMERQWAESACTPNQVEQSILADDFQGTSPDGSRYTKSQAIEDQKSSKLEIHGCRLNDAKVRFFGDNLAVIYGSESGTGKASDGTERTRTLIWTDTWLNRNGTWQVIAAQDMFADCH